MLSTTCFSSSAGQTTFSDLRGEAHREGELLPPQGETQHLDRFPGDTVEVGVGVAPRPRAPSRRGCAG